MEKYKKFKKHKKNKKQNKTQKTKQDATPSVITYPLVIKNIARATSFLFTMYSPGIHTCGSKFKTTSLKNASEQPANRATPPTVPRNKCNDISKFNAGGKSL